ncbi:TPA: hypothetical protein ACOLZ7_004389 [Vibrio parahaemolyticus]|uniref:hypothetical protein n=1 Tax=Vibrio parahaemolyticus TaxID=670 RepID=UPI001121D185|nr:hypothetical protein [Vibrio parahaemolyticus]EGR3441830.1 hypothetical protein [Vibrio parahaemolyticus]EJG1032796.1 hypothetical protein [Vibrio parahaemolyticus]ELA8087798.1 hypothetical protein [Vibrio parahaemolyticus]ELA8204771.1 hypothetical protein [Vibrio parahaemolyticus]MBM4946153.1 hypothetical protein [Vibrio parahaemolyticus]
MYQALNKQRQLNDMRLRQIEIRELLKDAPKGSELQIGLQAESIEISRLIPLVTNYVTDVSASMEQQAKEVEKAQAKLEANKERTSKLLMTLLKKREQLIDAQSAADAEKARLENEINSLANDPEAQAESKTKLANLEAKMTRLGQMKKALDFNQANAPAIAAGDEKLQVADPQAMADIAMRQRAVDAALDGTIAHEIALEALQTEKSIAEAAFFAEVDSYIGEA